MKILQNQQNVNPPSGPYPKGETRDKTIAIAGTIFSHGLMSDPIQAFQKLIVLSGITENDLFDNETNGYQLIESLFAQSLPQWKNTSSNINFSGIKFVTYSNSIYYHKTAASTDTAPDSDSTNWAFILGWDGSKIITVDTARVQAIEDNSADTKRELIQITNWNMGTTTVKVIAVSGLDPIKVVGCSAFIRNDAGVGSSPLINGFNNNPSGEITITAGNIHLAKYGTLWSSGYTGIGDRGYIILETIPE